VNRPDNWVWWVRLAEGSDGNVMKKGRIWMNKSKGFVYPVFFLLFTPFLCLKPSYHPEESGYFSCYARAEVESCDKRDEKGLDKKTDVRPLRKTAQLAPSDFPLRDCF
jgi:hypothetical protein